MHSLPLISDLIRIHNPLKTPFVFVEDELQGGFFHFIEGETRIDDGGVVFSPRGIPVTGKWVRIINPCDPVCVTWFGARGQAFEGGSQVNDTKAISLAFDYVIKQWRIARRDPLLTDRPKSLLPSLYFPPGAYLVTSSKVFANRIGFKSMAGVVIRGAGERSTEIVYQHTGSISEEDYLIFNNGDFRDLQIEDISFRGVSGKEKLLLYRSSLKGNAQNLVMRKVGARDFHRTIDVRGSTNADKNVFDKCSFQSRSPGNRIFSLHENSQSILHSFRDCVMQSTDGIVFELRAGGMLTIQGGHFDALGSGCILVMLKGPGTKSTFGASQIVSFTSSKFELWDHGTWIDITSGKVYINGENNSVVHERNTPKDAPRIIIRARGQVHLSRCYFNLKVLLITGRSAHALADKPGLHLTECILPDPDIENWVTYERSDNKPIKAGIGRVTLVDCRPLQATHIKNSGIRLHDRAIDVHAHYFRGSNAHVARQKTFVFRQNPSLRNGLPAPEDDGSSLKHNVRFKIPRNALLIRIGIIKEAMQNHKNKDFKYTVFDGHDNALVELEAEGHARAAAFCPPVRQYCPMISDADRSFRIIASPDNPSRVRCPGMVIVEYL